MKERPILFSAPMVRAILAGTKTQTRRVIKPQPTGSYERFTWEGKKNAPRGKSGAQGHFNGARKDINYSMQYCCPYGMPAIPGHLNPEHHEPGRLWVRETFSDCGMGRVRYRASSVESFGFKWTPSIHMPRWASRILLEVVSVRVERLQDITPDDAIAEGLSVFNEDDANLYYSAITTENQWPDGWELEPVDAYRALWESINGADSWNANPWVWVVEFKRLTP